MHFVLRHFLAAVLLGSLAGGCTRSASSLDQRDARDPLLKRAQAKEKARDIDGAIDLYNLALDRKPKLAKAHLEVGLLYDKYREDYVRAIYHYERYIELRPQAEKKQLIQDLIRQARLSFAASLPDRPSGAIEAIHNLKREVDRLQGQLSKSGGGGGVPPRGAPRPAGRPPAPAAAAAAPGLPRPAPAQPQVDTYVVQRRDTLSRIAQRVYNDPRKWRKIYEANRGALASPESLQLGQTLIIPRP